MRKAARILGLTLLLAAVWTVTVYHRGVFPKPPDERLKRTERGKSLWIDKEKLGIHQLVLQGGDYERGWLAGEKTHHLLKMQEDSLNSKLSEVIPSGFIRQLGQVALMRWYWGADRYFEPWAVDEMYGVGQWAPKEYDYLADGFTRQAAYHGLHEVAQLMVDQGLEDMGCTVAAHPLSRSWVIGRNFDFEGGPVFDREKIMKWVFPDQGFAYVSVIWAGMVGAVTGVNEKGVYVSINAAGSRDFKRHGTPSTLVLTKALQNASTALEAVKILQDGQMFITDIFVVADRDSSQLFRVEKSPDRTEVLAYDRPVAIANHLDGPAFRDDPTNQYRKSELTTTFRQARGQKLLEELTPSKIGGAEEWNRAILKILRDKGEENGKPLHLGNRRAIDGLISVHSVIFNGEQGRLYVSRGPAVSGEFIGFDLASSFERREPVTVDRLPEDPLVTPEKFEAVKESFRLISKANKLIKKKKCNDANGPFSNAASLFPHSSLFYETLGDLRACEGDKEEARKNWSKSLDLVPAYFRQVESLKEKLK